MPAPNPDPLVDAVRMLRSAFPGYQFNIKDGQITCRTLVFNAAECALPLEQLVRLAAPRIKALEDAALKAEQEKANASGS